MLLKTEQLQFNHQIAYDDMEIESGKVTFICGASGCGKSTLLKMINGTITPTSGRIFYEGEDILTRDTIQLRKEISLVSQEVFLFEGTIEQNFQQFYQYRNEKMIEVQRIYELLELCKLEFPLHKVVTTMSGGERQRLYMAIFLSFFPKVLLLDEPTSALDATNSEEVISNIIGFAKQNRMSTVIVSHDQGLAKKFSDKMIYLEKKSVPLTESGSEGKRLEGIKKVGI